MIPQETFSLPGVHIFSAGKWNGRDHSEADLDAMVSAFSALRPKGVRPFIKLGHDDEQELLQKEGLPAAGWIENVRRVGKKLYADFVDVPKKIYQLILNKGYRKVSIEVLNELELEGQKYPKFLFSVALLGNELPAVHNLDDLLSMYGLNLKHAGCEKFDAAGSPDILEVTELEKPVNKYKGTAMDLEQLKSELAKEKGATEELRGQIQELTKSVGEFKELFKAAEDARKEAETKLANATQETITARAEKFATDLLAEKLIPKSAEGLVKDFILGKDKFSIDGKEVTKEQSLKEILKLTAEAAKVNFSATTAKGEKDAVDSRDLQAQIDKYAKENNCSYVDAYKAVTRGKNLDAKPLGSASNDEG
jgi:hypothetical protein